MIRNDPVIADSLTRAVREQNELRGLWVWQMIKAAGRRGLDEEAYARGAIRKLGHLFSLHHPRTDSVREYMDSFLTPTTLSQFGAELVRMDDEEAVVHFHYCPMLGMWRRLSGDEEALALVCDCAMDVDRGIFDCYPGIDFRLDRAIGAGDEVCEIHLLKHKDGAE